MSTAVALTATQARALADVLSEHRRSANTLWLRAANGAYSDLTVAVYAPAGVFEYVIPGTFPQGFSCSDPEAAWIADLASRR
jgi:hypothetical protein